MLIRCAIQSDKEAWVELAKNIGEDTEHPKMYCVNLKIQKIL